MAEKVTFSKAPPSFDLTGRVAVITGGTGLLGRQHALALGHAGAKVVLLDLPGSKPDLIAQQLSQAEHIAAMGIAGDVTREEEVAAAAQQVLQHFGRVDILINNAANNPKMEDTQGVAWSRLENFPLAVWQADLAVGLTGAFLCSRVFGQEMARQRAGVILNIASDLALISPDQRLYRQTGVPEDQQPVKPVTYPVIKSALLGLTRYLATYWAQAGVRVNSISPGGVANAQPDDFVQRLRQLIPLDRMARIDEYQGAVLFLCCDASSYMTGANLVIDGGRTCW
jgi:NAD(P)-dependent dehydrogenase (short-subunit alcohol dehydrogenase family)